LALVGDQKNKNPGKVNATPAAMLSPAEPGGLDDIIFQKKWLFSEIFPQCNLITAMGIEAETNPAFKVNKQKKCQRLLQNKLPTNIDLMVSSFTCFREPQKAEKIFGR
jgi:hypothetical protein